MSRPPLFRLRLLVFSRVDGLDFWLSPQAALFFYYSALMRPQNRPSFLLHESFGIGGDDPFIDFSLDFFSFAVPRPRRYSSLIELIGSTHMLRPNTRHSRLNYSVLCTTY